MEGWSNHSLERKGAQRRQLACRIRKERKNPLGLGLGRVLEGNSNLKHTRPYIQGTDVCCSSESGPVRSNRVEWYIGPTESGTAKLGKNQIWIKTDLEQLY